LAQLKSNTEITLPQKQIIDRDKQLVICSSNVGPDVNYLLKRT